MYGWSIPEFLVSFVDRYFTGTVLHILEMDGSDLTVLPPTLWGDIGGKG